MQEIHFNFKKPKLQALLGGRTPNTLVTAITGEVAPERSEAASAPNTIAVQSVLHSVFLRVRNCELPTSFQVPRLRGALRKTGEARARAGGGLSSWPADPKGQGTSPGT